MSGSGNPDQATLKRQVLEALVADCLRIGRAGKDEARRWLGLGDAPDRMDAFFAAYRLTADSTEGNHGA